MSMFISSQYSHDKGLIGSPKKYCVWRSGCYRLMIMNYCDLVEYRCVTTLLQTPAGNELLPCEGD